MGNIKNKLTYLKYIIGPDIFADRHSVSNVLDLV